jgi:anti-sigma regulatory factor (Ser/Thr protein kinase)
LVSLAITLKQNNASKFQLPTNLNGYASRMKLWEAVGIANPIPIQQEKDSGGRFLPIEALTSRDKVDECSARLAKITTHANIDESSRKSLDISISELVDNCYAHAGISESLHGVACAQFWTNGFLAQIAIADDGMGIRQSLESAETSEVRDRVSKSNACELATELGVTSKPSGHAGYGLALARQMLENNGGTLIVCSGQEWFIASGGVCNSGSMGVNWRGTLIVCEFNTNRPLSTGDVYEKWAPVKGYEHDDFDF